MLTKQDWLLHLENRYTHEIELGLKNLYQVAKEFNLDFSAQHVVTVAGTNGKGTSAHLLAEIYSAAGYSVGLFTSPHLLEFNERIRVQGIAISDADLCDLFELIEQRRRHIPLRYFEVIALAAFIYFQRQALDIIILEIGMGGRLDAVNIIAANLMIITGIDYDHQAFLGDTLNKIAFEKAGIFRRNIPIIYADTQVPSALAACAYALNAPLMQYGSDFVLQDHGAYYYWHDAMQSCTFSKPNLHPNAIAAVLKAVMYCQAIYPVSTQIIQHAIATLVMPGRQQWFQQSGITLLIDVSHNAQSVAYLAKTIAQYSGFRVIHAVFAALKDKSYNALIQPLLQYVTYWYPALLTGKRAGTQEEMQHALKNNGIINVVIHATPLAAYKNALNNIQAGDLIIVYGSFHTAAEILNDLYNKGE